MSPRPNILFIMTDHTSARALARGTGCRTPNLDALAAEGFKFGRCYTTNAICSPARASLMTGAYPSTHGIWDCTHTQPKGWVNLQADRGLSFFSTHLADAGYKTGYFGKWHVEQSGQLNRFGWQESDLSSEARLKADPQAPRVVIPKEGYRDYVPAGVDTTKTDPRHPAFEKGIDFIRRAAADSAPFCCFVSAQEPHDPYIAPEKFLKQYALPNVPLSPSLHDNLHGKPDVVRRMHRIWEGLSDEDWRRITTSYWAVISFLDAEVGRLVRVLKETSRYDNTLIVFTSDHGDMMGAHGLCAKGVGTSYEEVYNIPLILRVPGLAGGVEDNASIVSMVDLGPTLLDLCLGTALPGAQGRSLKPVLENRAAPVAWRDAYAEFYGQRFVYTQRIVWHESWKYVFSPGGLDELYNLADDPFELTNLADDLAHRETLLAMCRRMWRKAKAIGDESLFNSHYAVLRTAPVGPLSDEKENR